MKFLESAVLKAVALTASSLAGVLAAVVLSGVLERPASAATKDVAIINFTFSPQTVEVSVGDTVTWTNKDSAPHTSTSDAGVWDSGILSTGGGFSFTFARPGTFPYFCEVHPFIRGTIVVSGAPAATTPTPTGPTNGSTLQNFNPTLTWTLPEGSTQYHVKVTPANNDGPGVNIIGNAAASFTIPPPPDWYGLLPDMGYTWMVRATNSQSGLGENNPGWGEWSQPITFRTPKVSSASINFVSPQPGSSVGSRNPTVQWSESNSNVFYYEVQVSKDPGFGPNAFLYWEMRHGGVTSPPNSYTIPPEFPLEPGTRYFWRVRPRVQGDGTPVGWSSSWNFSAP